MDATSIPFPPSRYAVTLAYGIIAHFCYLPTFTIAIGVIVATYLSLVVPLARREGMYDMLILQIWLNTIPLRLCYLGTTVFLRATCAATPRLSFSAGTVCGYSIITFGDTLVFLLFVSLPIHKVLMSDAFMNLLLVTLKYAMRALDLVIQIVAVTIFVTSRSVEIAYWVHSKCWQLLTGKTSAFIRAPLRQGEIRLLIINRRFPGFPLQLTLFTAKLQDAPPYEAISYSWGTINETREVSINGQSFETSAATYDALYSRSSMWRPMTVWIDYICVDQNNLAEKAAQVAQMCAVYRQATKAVVCLGQSRWTILALLLFHELLILQHNKVPAVEMYRFYEKRRLVVQWHAFIQFLNHRWFSRVWVIQEVAVAREVEVSCGSISFEWDTFIKLPDLFRHSNMCNLLRVLVDGRAAQKNLMRLSDIRNLRFDLDIYKTIAPSRSFLKLASALSRMLNQEENLQWQNEVREEKFMASMENTLSVPFLLARYHEFDATDGRDKLYALLGLAVDDMSSRFAPDYSKTQEALYLECAKEIWASSHPFRWIAFAGIGDQRRAQQLPSWVPDWTAPRTCAPLTIKYSPDETHTNDFKPFTASKSSIPQVSFDPAEPNAVNVQGLLIDRIELLTSISRIGAEDDNPWVDANGAMLSLRNWEIQDAWHLESWDFIHRNYEPMVNLSYLERLEAHWRILICNTIPSTRPAPPFVFSDYMAWLAANEAMRPYMLAVKNGDENVTLPTGDLFWRLLEGSWTWASYVGIGSNGKRLCATPLGRVGVVPPLTQAGDLLFIASGARTPWVVRPVNDATGVQSRLGEPPHHNESGENSRAYQLVGECYVHDIMDGEAMDELATQSFRFV